MCNPAPSRPNDETADASKAESSFDLASVQDAPLQDLYRDLTWKIDWDPTGDHQRQVAYLLAISDLKLIEHLLKSIEQVESRLDPRKLKVAIQSESQSDEAITLMLANSIGALLGVSPDAVIPAMRKDLGRLVELTGRLIQRTATSLSSAGTLSLAANELPDGVMLARQFALLRARSWALKDGGRSGPSVRRRSQSRSENYMLAVFDLKLINHLVFVCSLALAALNRSPDTSDANLPGGDVFRDLADLEINQVVERFEVSLEVVIEAIKRDLMRMFELFEMLLTRAEESYKASI